MANQWRLVFAHIHSVVQIAVVVLALGVLLVFQNQIPM
jgi:hypothetical protein